MTSYLKNKKDNDDEDVTEMTKMLLREKKFVNDFTRIKKKKN